MKHRRQDDEPITEERLERALMAAAYVVARHGPVYAPLFERLEKELADFRAKGDPVARARRYLEAHTLPAAGTPSIPAPAP